MSVVKKFVEALALYRKHGWRLERVLMRAETREALRQTAGGGDAGTFEGVAVRESVFDALWFRRAAQGGREAWELRLVGEPPFALFELFEADEEEEDREDVRREMEARLAERVGATGGDGGG